MGASEGPGWVGARADSSPIEKLPLPVTARAFAACALQGLLLTQQRRGEGGYRPAAWKPGEQGSKDLVRIWGAMWRAVLGECCGYRSVWDKSGRKRKDKYVWGKETYDVKPRSCMLNDLHCRLELLKLTFTSPEPSAQWITKNIQEKNMACMTRLMNTWTEVWATGPVVLMLAVEWCCSSALTGSQEFVCEVFAAWGLAAHSFNCVIPVS